MNHPKAIDLFCGVGGMSLGFADAGFEIVAAVDSDPINVQGHCLNFPTCKTIQADLSNLSGKDLLENAGITPGSVDAILGGPPCQGFSLIGKRRIDDERNQLLLHFARLVREIKPRYFVLENVPGLLIGRPLDLLQSFKRRVRRAGYEIVEPIQVLDATDFVIPQRRHRAFVLGFQTTVSAPEYPDRATFLDRLGKPASPTVWDAIGDLPEVDIHTDLLESDRYHGELGTPSQYAKSLRAVGSVRDVRIKTKVPNGHGLGGCLRTLHTKKTKRRFADTEPGTSDPVSRFFRLETGGVAPTLRAGTGPDHGSHTAARPIHPKAARCITTREAARLHSFPDWFEFHPTKWHGFRQVGNSVPPRMARAVAETLFETMRSGV